MTSDRYISDQTRRVVIDAIMEERYDDAIEMLESPEFRRGLGRRTILPICDTAIPPGSAVTIRGNPTIPFKPSRLLVGSSGFLIHDIRMGVNSMLPSAGTLSSDMFLTHLGQLKLRRNGNMLEVVITKEAEGQLGIPVDMPILEVGMSVFITVENRNIRSSDFYAGYLGSCP